MKNWRLLSKSSSRLHRFVGRGDSDTWLAMDNSQPLRIAGGFVLGRFHLGLPSPLDRLDFDFNACSVFTVPSLLGCLGSGGCDHFDPRICADDLHDQRTRKRQNEIARMGGVS